MPNVCFESIQPLPLIQAIALSAKNDMRILVATIDSEEDIDNLLIKDPDNFEALRLASQKHNEKRREADFIQQDIAFIFKKAISLFPTPYPSNIESRRQFLLAEGEALEYQLEKLNMDVYLDEIWETCKNIADHTTHWKT